MNKNTKKVPALRFPQFTDDWEQRELGKIFDYEQPQPYIVDSTDYNDSFDTPVLTAGQSFILGYTDEKNGIKNACPQNPVIIFDDFTTSSHYVDFPFKVKSSAMKLLSLCCEEDDVYCAFNVLQNIDYIPATHERHWISIFSNLDVLMPKDKKEQQQIGSYFRNLDNLITLHQRKYKQLKTLKKGLLQKMFPKKGESVPEIRFPQFTGDWEQRKLGELGEILTGSTPSTSHKEYYSDDGILWVTPTDISENIIYDTSRKLSDKGQEIARIAPKGTILVTCIASIGKNTMLGTMGSFNQQINALIPNFEKNNPYFLLTESMLWSEKMKQQAAAGTMQIVNKTEFSELVTIVPKLEEQEAIGNYFKSIDSLITLHQRKYEQLKTLKKALLQKMFI